MRRASPGRAARNRAVLAKLETKQQALILGHAVPMPVVVRTEHYGIKDSYATFKSRLGIAAVNDLTTE